MSPKSLFMKLFLLISVFAASLITDKSMAQGHAVSSGSGVAMASAPVYAGNTSSSASNYSNEKVAVSPSPHEGYAGAVGVSGGSVQPYNKTASSGFSSSVGSYSPNGPVAFMSGGGRYNYGAKRNFAYYSTPYSKAKSHSSDHISDRYFFNRDYQSFLSDPDYSLFFACDFIYDGVVANYETTHSSNEVLDYSFDGFAVYGKDTIPGIVTITKNSIYLEQASGEKHEKVYTFSYDNRNLKTVAVFDGYKELYLSRPTTDGKLLRVLHAGKLTIYDDHYSFMAPGNIDKTKITVAFNGQVKTPAYYLVSDSKKLLIEAANNAYGLHLQGQSYTWDKLFDYICGLD